MKNCPAHCNLISEHNNHHQRSYAERTFKLITSNSEKNAKLTSIMRRFVVKTAVFFLWRTNQTQALANTQLRFLGHIHTHTKGSTLWPSDQLVAEAATYTTHNKTQQTNIHAPSGIRTRDPSNQVTGNLCLKAHGHRQAGLLLLLLLIYYILFSCRLYHWSIDSVYIRFVRYM